MIRRIALTLLAMTALPVGAQVGRRSGGGGYNSDPGYWVGVSYGVLDGITLGDEKTNSVWQFAYTSQLRATLEKTMSGGITVGASAGFSNPKLTYTSSAIGGPCGVCQADAQVNQYMGFVRSGGGVGFHTLFSLEGGVTQFSKFRERDTGADLAPTTAAYDVTLGFGGGFGYGLSRTSEIYASEQLDLVLHHQGDVAGTQSSVPRMAVFRAGARVGF